MDLDLKLLLFKLIELHQNVYRGFVWDSFNAKILILSCLLARAFTFLPFPVNLSESIHPDKLLRCVHVLKHHFQTIDIKYHWLPHDLHVFYFALYIWIVFWSGSMLSRWIPKNVAKPNEIEWKRRWKERASAHTHAYLPVHKIKRKQRRFAENRTGRIVKTQGESSI